MRKMLLLLVLAAPAAALAGGDHHHGGGRLDPVHIDLHDKPSLQRGARLFMNYCLSCHSAAHMRYSRVAQDLGIPEDLMKQNLVFAGDKVTDLMKVAMSREDAKDWFGTAPPDLTLEARAREPSWIYTYLRSFYRDEHAPKGWNNLVFPNVAMPHVLYELQGEQRPVYIIKKETILVEQNGKRVEKTVERRMFDKFVLDRPGTRTPAEFDKDMRDLTNFLVYLGEPVKLVRYRLGVYVLLFLLVFFVFAYLLKKEYWKDVH